jgi:hypothetical protein
MPAPQFRQLKLDDARISEEYSKILHKLFTTHNIYHMVQRITARGKNEDWIKVDEENYEKIVWDMTRSIPSAAKQLI